MTRIDRDSALAVANALKGCGADQECPATPTMVREWLEREGFCRALRIDGLSRPQRTAFVRRALREAARLGIVERQARRLRFWARDASKTRQIPAPTVRRPKLVRDSDWHVGLTVEESDRWRAWARQVVDEVARRPGTQDTPVMVDSVCAAWRRSGGAIDRDRFVQIISSMRPAG